MYGHKQIPFVFILETSFYYRSNNNHVAGSAYIRLNAPVYIFDEKATQEWEEKINLAALVSLVFASSMCWAAFLI